MTNTTDVLGPVDWLVVEFPADLVFIRKDEDGSIDVDELSDVPEGAVGEFLAQETAMAMFDDGGHQGQPRARPTVLVRRFI